MTPLPKRGFGPPLVRYVFHPPQVSVLCFSCTKIHDRADQKLFWRGPKIFGRARSLVRFPPPIRFAPPHIMAQNPLKIPSSLEREWEGSTGKQPVNLSSSALNRMTRHPGQTTYRKCFNHSSMSKQRSEGRGCLQEGCLGLPGVLPDILRTAIFPRK